MTAAQRRLHVRIWLLLGPVLLAVIVLAVEFRRPIPAQEPPGSAVPHGGTLQ